MNSRKYSKEVIQKGIDHCVYSNVYTAKCSFYE